MMFLDLTSDPNTSATEKDYANSVIRNESTSEVQNKGCSAKSYTNFALCQLQFFKATKFKYVKTTPNRHLSTSIGFSSGTNSCSNNNGQAASPGANSRKKKRQMQKEKKLTKRERTMCRCCKAQEREEASITWGE